MAYDITVRHVAAQPLAAARERMAAREIPARFKVPLDKVWAFLKQHPELHAPHGHNVFLYRHDMGPQGEMTIDFGVQASRPFEAKGDVHCAMTPDGAVATTMHRGPYSGLKPAHEAIHAWADANGRRIGGWSWEIYGDPTPDPQKTETEILYLLAP